jgi:hypothetical protein
LQVEECEAIANLRIHVERAMARVKEFSWLGNSIKVQQVDLVTDIFTIAACIGNYSLPLQGADFWDATFTGGGE